MLGGLSAAIRPANRRPLAGICHCGRHQLGLVGQGDEDLYLVSSQLLGLVQGLVGVAEQLLKGFATCAQRGYANADSEWHALPLFIVHMLLLHRLTQRLCDQVRVGDTGLWQHDHEFFST